MEKHKSDSSEQKEVEKNVIDWLRINIDQSIISKKFELDGVNFQMDACTEDGTILCEIYAGIDEIKAGQKRKIITDLFKLLLIEKLLDQKYGQSPREKYLVFVDKKVKAAFEGLKLETWAKKGVETFGIKILVAEISKEDRQILEKAKKRQKMK